MNILALDAGNESCSVALAVDNNITALHELAPRNQTQLLLPMVDELLRQNSLQIDELDAVAFNRGPGSFTGIRLTASVAQGLAFAGNTGILPISALDALAYQQYSQSGAEYIFAALDARKSEIYYAFYHCQKDVFERISQESVGLANKVIAPLTAHWSATGTGVDVYSKALTMHSSDFHIDYPVLPYADAKHIALLALQLYCAVDVLTPEQAIPVYIRDQVTG